MQSPNIEITATVAGDYTKLVSNTTPATSNISLTSGAISTISSINLPAGVWDVSGVVGYHSATGTTVPEILTQGINTVTNAFDGLGSYTSDYLEVPINYDPIYGTGTHQIVLDLPGTVYLLSNVVFTVSSLVAYGSVRARRVY